MARAAKIDPIVQTLGNIRAALIAGDRIVHLMAFPTIAAR